MSTVEHEGWRYVSADTLTLPSSRAWRGYWDDRRGRDGHVRLGDVDPALDVPHLIEAVCWIEALDDGDYLYRVVGTAVRDHYGEEFTGKRLSQIRMRSYEREIKSLFDGMRRDLTPVYMDGYYMRDKTRETKWEATVLPIVNDTGTLARILVGLAFAKKF